MSIINEDELPEMTEEEYDEWYENSYVQDNVGCHVGPKFLHKELK